jgi:imidazolonepropionase
MSSTGGGRRLLIRDLAQLATPRGTEAPLRGHALGDVEVLEDAYVLCVDGNVEAIGRMQDLRSVEGEVEELDARGLCAVPGLVDCHTHACFAGDRVEEFALRAGGATYEELHAAGGGIMATVKRDAGGERGRARRRRPHASHVDAACRHDDLRVEVRVRPRPRHGAGVLEGDRRSGRRPDVAGRPRGAARVPDADAYVDFMVAEVLPDAAELAEAADVFLERGAFDVAQARRYLEACGAAGLALRLHGDQFTQQGAVALAIELGARSVDHLEATGDDGVRALAAGAVVAVLLPASALFLGRPMPPARALVDSGAAVALATDFNPGSAFCESLPLVCSLAATQLKLSPSEALSACTVNAAHVLGRADRVGRLGPGYAADILLLDAPTGAISPITWAAPS